MSKKSQNQPMSPAVGSDPSELLAKRSEAAQAAEARLREATREANEAVKGLAEQRRSLEALRADVDREAADRFKDRIDVQVRKGLDVYSAVLEESIKKAEAAVNRRFDKLSKILMGEEKNSGQPSLSEYVQVIEETFDLKWKYFYEYLTAALYISRGCNVTECGRPAGYSVLLRHVRTPGLTVEDIAPPGEDPAKFVMEGHMHVCPHHFETASAAGEVVRYFRLETRVCPYGHANLTPGSVGFVPDRANTKEK